MDVQTQPGALTQRRFEIGWSVVLLEKIAKGFVRQFLEIHHAIARQRVKRQPGFVIKLNSFAGHGVIAD